MPEVDTDLIEDPDPNGPFGAKEVGQGPLLPIMPAVANAVYDAVGVRIDEMPITPEKILKALRAEGARASPRASARRRFPHVAVARAAARAAAVGRRRRPRLERTGEEVDAQGGRRRRSDRGGAVMMRLPPFRYRAPRTVAEARAVAGRVAGPTRCWSPAAPICCRT